MVDVEQHRIIASLCLRVRDQEWMTVRGPSICENFSPSWHLELIPANASAVVDPSIIHAPTEPTNKEREAKKKNMKDSQEQTELEN